MRSEALIMQEDASLSIADLLTAFDAQDSNEAAAVSQKKSSVRSGSTRKKSVKRRNNPGSCGLPVPDPEADGFTSVFDETSDFILKPQKQSETVKARSVQPVVVDSGNEEYDPLEFCARLISDPAEGECVCQGKCVLYSDCEEDSEAAEEKVSCNESGCEIACVSDCRRVCDPLSLDRLLADSIGSYISQNCRFDTLVQLVSALFRAKGLQTLMCVAKAEEADLFVSGGALGMGGPSVCIRVLNSSAPADAETITVFDRAIRSSEADYGIMISPGGFTDDLTEERCAELFAVRLWNLKILAGEIMRHYTRFDSDSRCFLPMKQVWVLDI